jgi:phosphorylcholine metabolism protein LicD
MKKWDVLTFFSPFFRMYHKSVFYLFVLLSLTVIAGLILINTGQQDTTMTFQRQRPAFEDRLEVRKNLLEIIKNHTITKSDRETFLNIFHFMVKLARKKNWTHFIQWGSLLGSWRHHGMIPYDADVDMYFELKDRDDIIKTIATQREFIAKQMFFRNKELKLYSRSNSTKDYYYSSTGRWKGPYMDLYFFSYTRNGHVKCSTLRTGYWLKTDIFPLQNRPFEDMDVPAPRNALKVLQQMYGKTDECTGGGVSYKCRDIDGIYPFVHRKFSNGTLIETLKLGSKEIQVKILFNVSETDLSLPRSPFTLDNSGFRVKSDCILLVLMLMATRTFFNTHPLID